jgi:hypothetical protein
MRRIDDQHAVAGMLEDLVERDRPITNPRAHFSIDDDLARHRMSPQATAPEGRAQKSDGRLPDGAASLAGPGPARCSPGSGNRMRRDRLAAARLFGLFDRFDRQSIT